MSSGTKSKPGMIAGRPSESAGARPMSLSDLKGDEQRFHLSLPAGVHRRLRLRSAVLRVPMAVMVAEWIERGLDEAEAEDKRAAERSTPASSVGNKPA